MRMGAAGGRFVTARGVRTRGQNPDGKDPFE